MIDSQTLLQWTGCLLGVAGSIALARNDRYSGWGFVAYLASNAAWLAYGYASDIPALVLQHLVFAAVSTFGVWRWLVLPRIKARAANQLATAVALTAASSDRQSMSTEAPRVVGLATMPIADKVSRYAQASFIAAQLSALQSGPSQSSDTAPVPSHAQRRLRAGTTSLLFMDAALGPRRVTTSVDLGELRARLIEVSAAAGLGPSTWIRQLVRRELSAEGSPAVTKPDAVVPAAEGVYRAWLDTELTTKLDLLTVRGGFRTRVATLRALVEGVNVGDSSVSLVDAVEALGASTHRLVAIGRNINQIAKALHGAGGKARTGDVIALDDALRVIYGHVDLAANLVGELRPMFKSKGQAS